MSASLAFMRLVQATESERNFNGVIAFTILLLKLALCLGSLYIILIVIQFTRLKTTLSRSEKRRRAQFAQAMETDLSGFFYGLIAYVWNFIFFTCRRASMTMRHWLHSRTNHISKLYRQTFRFPDQCSFLFNYYSSVRIIPYSNHLKNIRRLLEKFFESRRGRRRLDLRTHY